MFDPSFGLTLWQTLVGALVVAGLLMLLTRRWRLAAIVSSLLADWCLCTFVPDLTDAQTPVWNWLAWGFVDVLIGLIVVVLIADNALSMLIAFILVCEVGAHIAFGMNHVVAGPPDNLAQVIYWTFTHWGAWLQVWLLAFWIGRDAVQMVGTADLGDVLRRIGSRVRGKGALARKEETP